MVFSKEEFFELCKEKEYSEKDIKLFEKALFFMEDMFSEEPRLSGGTVAYHNLMVGKILAELSSSSEVVAAGLLHGLGKYKKEIHQEFGKDILELINGVAQIREIKNKNKTLQAEAIKKILVTTMTDTRVITIKLANELENFRNIENLPKEKQQRLAEEALEIYAPLAYRLGSEKLRTQLENYSFKILNPRKYAEIENFLKASSHERERHVAEAIDLIKEAFSDKVHILKIKGRPKHIYSIYKKLAFRKVSLHEQADLFGIRIAVEDEKDCYTALAILHEKFHPIEGRLKDYIAAPKENGYRSIHTGLLLPNKREIEVQIRTVEMDEYAEEGIAAHWKYKGHKGDEKFEKRVGWLKAVLNLQKTEGNKEFLEATRVDVFGDRIYCYTPKGDAKELPVGASVLDFAFNVHEHVGWTAIGGKVNGKFVALKYELHKGDVVEILTNKKQRPHRTWLKFVKTANARHKIRKALKEHEDLPAIHYKIPKAVLKETDKAYLAESKDFANAACVLAKCCNPIPGDDITGIPTKKRVISVHLDNCKYALKDEDRWTKVYWKESFGQNIRFLINAQERSGLLADILNTIVTAGFEVKEAKAKLLGPQDMECSFLVVPRRLEELVEMIRRVKKLKGVRRITFES
jgi:GTP diphosphokinase / guanosine-3',5'-bis(diphosphate) 3'-diphosphatase